MKYVYILQSIDAEHFYVGVTDDLRARLTKHNAGEVPHTSKYLRVAREDLCRLHRRKTGIQLRKVSKIPLGPRLRQEAALD
jgi:predicted GIY-YIG superfamily endonuclease